MKILASEITFLSDHQSEQLDLSLNEQTTRTTASLRRQRGAFQGDTLSAVMVDRVSIFQKQTHEFQSNYTASVSSTSTVKTNEPKGLSEGSAAGEPGETLISHEQHSAMEKLVGGVINKEVVINAITAGSDIVLKNGDTISAQEKPVDENSDRFQTTQRQTWEMSLTRTDIHFEDEQMKLASAGNVTTQDGRQIDFSLDISLNRTFVSRTREQALIQIVQQQVNLTDPLVISLDGKAPTLSDARFKFDLDSDGTDEQVSFLNSGSGFLAFDKNSDNSINNGSELFGPGTGNGFEELAVWDEDQNHWIDENDDIYSKLSVWTRNENGEDQLISLKNAGVGAIALDYAQTQFDMTTSDNTLQGQLKSTGLFLFEDGNVGSVSQVDLASGPVDPPESAPVLGRLKAGEIFRMRPFTERVIPGAGMASVAAFETVPTPANPLNELRDRIKELKEQMGHLLEKMSLAAPEHGRKRHRSDGFRFADMKSSSFLMSGYLNRPNLSRQRFV